MTIETLVVTDNGLPSGWWKIRLGSAWLQLNLWVPSWVLKIDWSNYVTQWQVQWGDIENNTIEGTKIANNAITSSKLDTWSVTNSKIQDGVIDCSKIDLSSFPGLSCSTSNPNNFVCPSGQFIQWITSTWAIICIPGGWWVACNEWQIPVWSWWTWTCQWTNSWPGTWSSFWDFNSMTEHIRNNNNWNVGIWVNNPTSKLTVSGSVLVSGSGVINTWTLSSGTIGTVWTTATPDENAILYVNNGKVGILTSNPSYTLDVVGTIRAASIITSSDARLKTNIKVIDNALAWLLGVNGYSYTLKSDGLSQYWVLAQEIEQFFPYLVSTDNNWYKAVNYNGLIAPIIQAIHELDSKVQSIEAKYQSNEQRIQALEKRLTK